MAKVFNSTIGEPEDRTQMQDEVTEALRQLTLATAEEQGISNARARDHVLIAAVTESAEGYGYLLSPEQCDEIAAEVCQLVGKRAAEMGD